MILLMRSLGLRLLILKVPYLTNTNTVNHQGSQFNIDIFNTTQKAL